MLPPSLHQEYCNEGTLRQALDRGRLKDPRSGRTHLPTALALARDVAAAMQYLHQQQVWGGGKNWSVGIQKAYQEALQLACSAICFCFGAFAMFWYRHSIAQRTWSD